MLRSTAKGEKNTKSIYQVINSDLAKLKVAQGRSRQHRSLSCGLGEREVPSASLQTKADETTGCPVGIAPVRQYPWPGLHAP